MIVIVTCKNEDDQLKGKALEYSKHFSHCKSMGFFRRSSAANSAMHNPIRLNFELSPDFIIMVVLVTCNNEEDPIKNEGAKVFSKHYTLIFQMHKDSLLRSLWWDFAEIRIHPSFYACTYSLQE